eukprot:5578097-Prymnesium_polylepis.1
MPHEALALDDTAECHAAFTSCQHRLLRGWIARCPRLRPDWRPVGLRVVRVGVRAVDAIDAPRDMCLRRVDLECEVTEAFQQQPHVGARREGRRTEVLGAHPHTRERIRRACGDHKPQQQHSIAEAEQQRQVVRAHQPLHSRRPPAHRSRWWRRR